MGKSAAVKTILTDFSGWTSAHGIPHIGSAQGCTLRTFWTLVTLSSLAMFSLQMYTLVTKYLEYGSSIQTELKFEKRTFPSVTVCNLNPVIARDADTSAFETNSTESENIAYEEIVQLNDVYRSARNVSFGGPADALIPDYGFEAEEKERWNQELADKHARMIVASNQENLNKTLNLYDKDELVMNCAYNTKPDFETRHYAQYGGCLTFNPTGKYESTRAGPLYGLRLLLRTHQDFYQPYVKSAGVRVAIHSNISSPFTESFGYNAAPGFATSFGIKFVETNRLTKPWGTCVSEPEGSYNFDGEYIIEGCYRSCLNDEIISKCGCFDPKLAEIEPTGSTSCAVGTFTQVYANIKCLQTVLAEFNVVDKCTCNPNCIEQTYSVTVSTALWPSEVYAPPSCNNYQLTKKYWKEIRDCMDWYSKNTVLIEVYYERMNYQILKQVADYGIINLISDTGGQLGLWLGVSFITVVEFASLSTLVTCYCLCASTTLPGTDADGEDDDDDDDDDEDDDEEEAKKE